MTPDELLPQVYDELRKLAAAKLAHEKPAQTLQATAHAVCFRCLDMVERHKSQWSMTLW